MLQTFVKPTTKGQITLPIKIRRQLGVDDSTLLKVVLEGARIIINPVKIEAESTKRLYSDAEINEFLRNDKIEEKDWQKDLGLLMKNGRKSFSKFLEKNNLNTPKNEEETYELIDKTSGRC